MIRPVASMLALVALVAFASESRSSTVEWNAASGSPPDSVCPAWTRGTNGGTANLLDGALNIVTGSCGTNAFFLQSDTSIAIPDTLVLEARLAVDSGSECVGPCGHYRGVAALNVTTAPNVGSLCFVSPGQVLLVTSACGGALTASVPTSGMHTYRIVILHGTQVSVSQDGVPLLTGSTFTSAPDHGPSPRVLWGDGSSLAFGTARWQWVRHNAHADGCATASVDPSSIATAQARLVAAPNPFRASTTLRFTATHAGPARVGVYDVGGRRVRVLHTDGAAGERLAQWDGLDDGGARVRPGTYFVRALDDSRAGTGVVLRLE